MFWGCSSGSSMRTTAEKQSGDRRVAPNFSLKDADGKTVQLSDYRGKVVMLNFWATWCGPCKYEIPWFIEFERTFKNQGLAIIGVSMDDDGWSVVKPFASNAGINYRIVLGDDTVAQQYGGVDSLPTTFLIDRDGNIAATHVGLVSKTTYENDLKKLLQSSARGTYRIGSRGIPALLVGPVR
jgi:cytochrome c biogenesis protein CcmG/thiol:disulfide interchange protein DsbE